jgi:hypothetical protein
MCPRPCEDRQKWGDDRRAPGNRNIDFRIALRSATARGSPAHCYTAASCAYCCNMNGAGTALRWSYSSINIKKTMKNHEKQWFLPTFVTFTTHNFLKDMATTECTMDLCDPHEASRAVRTNCERCILCPGLPPSPLPLPLGRGHFRKCSGCSTVVPPPCQN